MHPQFISYFMPDGTLIQERDIERVPSTRRNPIIAEIFHRLDYIERRGSGFNKILSETVNLCGYTDAFAPVFRSTPAAFHVILKNMNYDLHGNTTQVAAQDNTQDKKAKQLLEYCAEPRTRDEMQLFIGIANREHFRKAILKPLLDMGTLQMTIPDKQTAEIRNMSVFSSKIDSKYCLLTAFKPLILLGFLKESYKTTPTTECKRT